MSFTSLLVEEKKASLHIQEARRKAQEMIEKAKAEAEKIMKSMTSEEKIRKPVSYTHLTLPTN